MEYKELLLNKLNEFKEGVVLEFTDFRDDASITLAPENLIPVCTFLKNDPDLEFLICKDVTAIDWAARKNRFTAVYHIYSFKLSSFLRIKVNLSGNDPSVDSVTSVWKGADWYERETYDMYGIIFKGHPDLRRMYMPEAFEYYPLRKEFPVMGIPGSIPLPSKD
ncbi:MAG: NADH-quinone oxidoreductase subunit C [Ignavibacteriales bacterium]|nr:NADH-quinone oxidoreductase subunit C [Ignavibacteriales bacterium]MCF8315891.1 NADH-quinone oxidoreductase subunit C [Ignavibacteriales bacterium]MCF8437351.1 NADH-quinone oxidoreductase subunit C [Ignavibacteriales bacterium]